MQADKTLSPKQAQKISIIRKSANRLLNLINQILEFRKTETENRKLKVCFDNLSLLIQEIGIKYKELNQNPNVKIRIKTDAQESQIYYDQEIITIIIDNLMSNALKRGTFPEITLSINSYEDNNIKYTTISVEDTGHGISKESLNHIFERYYQGQGKYQASGSGIGLALVKSLADLHQATIEVESEVNQYAQFIVNLPQLEVTGKAERILNEEVPKSEPFNHKTSTEITERDNHQEESNQPEPTILMIDDNKELLWMLKDILSDEYSVLTAENGEEGLTILKQKTPDLIITDIMMPKIDGITLIKQLKSNKHTMHIPLVILSAKNTTDEKIEGIESGADAYIPKPFNTQYLKSIIKQLLKKQEELKQYYNSSASAFEFSGGHLLQQEDKKFIETAVELINRNMDNTKFGPEELAGAMQTSSRNLYRKFKNLEQLPPKDFIKEQRINYAAKLLLTTTLTIQEVMYRTAFTNRSHFYKEFGKRYNQTPKEYRESNKHKDNSLN